MSVRKFSYALVLCALGAIGLGQSQSASAEAGDRTWAGCIWRTAPLSAANWLAMPTPDWHSPFESAPNLLGLRLAALCGAPAIEARGRIHAPNFRRMTSSLRSTRPNSVATTETSAPTIDLCINNLTTNGRTFVFRYDIARRDGSAHTIVHRQYFDSMNGQPVQLPLDLSIVPRADQPVTSTCKTIDSSGILLDV